MLRLSPHAKGSLVCLVCAGVLYALFLALTHNAGFIVVILAFVFYLSAFVALAVGVIIGFVGTIASSDLDGRLQSVIATFLCNVAFVWLLLKIL